MRRTIVVIFVCSLFATVELHLCGRSNPVSRRVIRPAGRASIGVHTLCPATEAVIRMRGSQPVGVGGLE